MLTCGNPVNVGALMQNLGSAEESITAVAPGSNNKKDRIGRVRVIRGERSAHLSFILPEEDIDCNETTHLLDGLAIEAGNCGILSLLADLEEDSQAFEIFRKCGYSVYTHQHVFRRTGNVITCQEDDFSWTPISSRNGIGVRNLYQSLVPPLVQGTEPLPPGALQGWVCIQEGETVAFAFHKSGPIGDVVQPIIHPDAQDTELLLRCLVHKVMLSPKRAFYLVIRSYQSWMEKYLSEENWEISPRQVLLIKHLASYQRVPVTNERRAVIETNPKTEPTVPIAGIQMDPNHEPR